MKLAYSFVKNIPEELEDGTVYISVEYATAIHKCCCGCGNEVVTPLSPTDWRLTFDGNTITLYPSIGNWNPDCQSHYWITKSEVIWTDRWGKEQIQSGQERDGENKRAYRRREGWDSLVRRLLGRK